VNLAPDGDDYAVNYAAWGELLVILLGIILIILGAILNIPILYTIGVVLLVVGAVFWILGAMGRAVGGRRHYW
jgi:hypothetical protein